MGYSRYNRYRKFREYKIALNKECQLGDCWLAEYKYLRLDGRYIHQEWARGSGEIVRHLCGDNRCLNPVHLVRGSELENALDEIEVRDFMLGKYKDQINDRTVDEYPNEVQWLVILPRVQVWFRNERNLEYSLNDIRAIGRDEYRAYVSYKIRPTISDGLLQVAAEKLRWLVNRKDIEIQLIKNF